MHGRYTHLADAEELALGAFAQLLVLCGLLHAGRLVGGLSLGVLLAEHERLVALLPT